MELLGDLEKPFLLPIEDVFSISGRGTVATGRVSLASSCTEIIVTYSLTGRTWYCSQR